METGAVGRGVLALVAWLGALGPAGADQFGAVLALSSDNVFRGVSLSDGDPALQAGAHYTWSRGGFVGLSGATIKQSTYTSVRRRVELDTYAGYGFNLGSAWDGRIALVHYAYPRSDPERRSHDELAVTVSWFGRVSLTGAVSPNRPGSGNSRQTTSAWELALRWPAARGLWLEGGAGYQDLRRAYDIAYAYWSAGVAYAVQDFTLGMSWIEADDDARDGYGEAADGRAVATALWAF